MVKQTIFYKGDLRCEAVHGPSKTALNTDAPVDNMGKGESFSPSDLLTTAFATCVLTTMAITAKKQGIELGPSSAEIEKHMTTQPPRRVAKIVCRMTLSGIDDPDLRETLEEIAHTCPVELSLHPDIEREVSIKWQ